MNRGDVVTIEPVVTKLRVKLATISTGSKTDFLAAFGPIHQRWHMAEMMRGAGTFGGKPIGFLSFHHEVLTVYQTNYAKTLKPATMARPAPPYRASIDKQPNIEFFAAAIEDWHNSVHRNVRKYGTDFADPMKNIYMPRFWQFHKFINNKFSAYLTAHRLSYDGINHTTI